MKRWSRWRKRRAWKRLLGYGRAGRPNNADPRPGTLVLHVPMGNLLDAPQMSLEQRGQVIDYASAAAGVAASQVIRQRYPIAWDADRMKRVRVRKEKLKLGILDQPGTEWDYSLEKDDDAAS